MSKVQTNLRLEEKFIKRLKMKALEQNTTYQDIVEKYLILGISLEQTLETRKQSNQPFEMPIEFEIVKTGYETL